MGFRSLPTLLIQTLDALTALRPRVLKVGPGLGLTDNADGTATVAASAIAASTITTGQLAAARGGTGVDGSAAANGTVLIGNGSGYSLATLTAGSNVTITNGAGSITIASSGGGGGGSPATMDITVANTTGSAIADRTVVYWTDLASSGAPKVAPTIGNQYPGFGVPLGMTIGSIANGATGTCRLFGIVDSLDTHTFSVGDDVYAGTSGAFVSSSIYQAWLGLVLVSHASTGQVFVGSGISSLTYVGNHEHTRPSDGGSLTNPSFLEVSAPGSAVSGEQFVYVDDTTHHLTREDFSGTIVDIERSSSAVAYTTGTDQTGSRALNTNYTNGSLRRRVHATVDCVATIANAATIGGKTTVGGTALNLSDQAGAPSGIIQSDRAQLNFEVDPGATYGVNSSIGGSSTATLVRWIEVDE